jgi:ribosomal protein S18 acetylase RimI-like enzyme
MADPKDLAAQLSAFNAIEAEQPWYKKQLPMEGRATFLPFRDTMEGSVFNKREVALPGILAGALNAFTAPERARTSSDPTFNAGEEAANFALNTFGGGVATGKALRNPTGQGGVDLSMNAWHGSPHNIEGNFDLAKVGAGAGNQAYGHGIYFGQARGTGEEYRRNLSSKVNYDQNTNKYQLLNRENKIVGEFDNMAQVNKEAEKLGNLYKVDIPDEQIPMMLDWDKPISQQSEGVLNAIKANEIKRTQAVLDQRLITKENLAKEGKDTSIVDRQIEVLKDEINNPSLPSQSGENYYNYLTRRYTPKEASRILNELGITGIRYLDEKSRSKGSGTSNFVVFKPETVKILEKNDLPVNPIKDLSDKWNSKGVDLDVYSSKDGTKINLSKISVDPKQRNQGIGSQVMKDIIQQADNTNAIVTLSPSVDFGGTSVARLKDFYKEFGFVENKGRNKDLSISETMYRKPVQTLPTRKELLQQEFDKLDK